MSILKKRVKTPTILQMEVAECGAAALAIILAYYGRYESLATLRIACGVSRDGSKAINMLRAARQYGLHAQAVKAEPGILPELNFPLIAFWEFNHFVVIEGIDAKKVYLNDPATGPRTVSHEQFDSSFTGIILLFEPTKNFQPGGQKDTLQNSLGSRLKGSEKALFYVVFISLMLVIPGILIPGFSKIFIDEVLIQHLSGWLIPLLWGMVLTVLLRVALTWLQQIHLLRLQLKFAITTSAQFLWHILRLPLTFFTQRFAGDISTRLAANDRIATLLSGDLSTSLVSIIAMGFFAIMMFLYDWSLTLLGIFAAFLNATFLWYVAHGIQNNSRRLQQEVGRLTGIEMIGLQGIETLKAISAEDDFFQKWAGYHAKIINSQQKIALYSRTLLVLPQLITGLTTVAVLSLGGWQVMSGYLTIGSLVAFQSLLASFNEPLITLLGFGNKLQEIRADLTRVDDVLLHPEDVRLSIKEKKIISDQFRDKSPIQLELRNLSFGYSPLDPPLLSDINLHISSQARIGIVGASGSGKSTLAKLICGLYQPWLGEILLNHQTLSTIPTEVLSSSLAFVDQDIFLFEGTLRENLIMWNPSISGIDIKSAIQDACLEPIISTRNGGLDSWVISDGANFSGGQRQQMEIARALTTLPSLLILDEATSALDIKTEHSILHNLKQRRMTLIIITHRLSTIRDCDEIIVLDQGRIVERGTHEKLFQQKGYYRKLMESD